MSVTPEKLLQFIQHDKIEEVELRYKFGVPDIIRFLESNKSKFANKCTLTRTTNIIYLGTSGDKKDYIICKDYDTDEVTYSYKKREVSMKLTGNIILNVSREIPSNSAARPTKQDFLARIKNRLTMPCEDGRFDVTQVSQIEKVTKSNHQLINSRKTDLFMPMDNLSGEKLYEAFINNMYNHTISSVELEYEFNKVSDPSQLTITYANQLLGEEFANTIIKSNILAEVAADIGYQTSRSISLKSLLNNATCLTAAVYNRIYPPIDWFITPKADGYVGLVIMGKAGKNYIIYSDVSEEVNYGTDDYTILVGEVVGKTFYCFDILMDKGSLMMQRSFTNRWEAFMRFLNAPIQFGEYTLVAKDHVLITSDLQRSFKSVIELPKPYEIDGYVLVSPSSTYMETKNYKIKEHNTIDFLVIECPPSFKKEEIYKKPEGTTGETYLLFCTINEYELERIMIQPLKGYQLLFPQRFSGVMPIQFCPTDNPLAYIWHSTSADTKKIKEAQVKGRVIAELDAEHNSNGFHWKLIKIREDRVNEPNYFGNHMLKVAEPSWLATKYPFTINDMARPLDNYFGTGKGEMYKAQTGFNSFVKSKLLTQATSMITSKVVIDLAAGKGQDLARYYDAEFTRGVFCDIDPVALSELVARRYDITRDKTRKNKMQVYTVHRDLNMPADDTVEILKPFIRDNNIGLIVCNFAIHYMITDIDRLNNFIRMVRGISSKGTIFYFTTMCGKSVIKLLGEGNEWKVHQNGVLKYHIVKKFNGNTLADMGQTISTKMPFSDELYDENLVNVDLVNNQFIKYGFKLIASENFNVFFGRMKTENQRVFDLLSEDDKKFVSLYRYSLFEC